MSGYKTYLVSVLGIIVIALNVAGIVPDSARDELLKVLGFAGLAALRAAVTKGGFGF